MMKTRKLALLTAAVSCALTVSLSAQTPPPAQPQPGPPLVFTAAGTNGFAFDTGVLRGTLRAGDQSKGLTAVVHLPTGMRLDASMGLFSHYRVFSADKRYGTAAWDWPGEATLLPDGTVQVRWPATPERPFELGALYRWTAPNTLDLETTVTAKASLVRFESFLASYFAPEFTNSLVCAANAEAKSFMAADPSYGVFLAFPRDDAALAIIRDGRWKIEPNPVEWVLMPRLVRPLAMRRAPVSGLTVLLMAAPKDCFAVYSPQQADGHRSLYFSFFGQDLKPGDTARASARLLVAPTLSETAAVQAYDDYAKTWAGGKK